MLKIRPFTQPEFWLWDRKDNKAVELRAQQTTLGRKADLSFPKEKKISREHCRLLQFEGHLYAVDLHSTNRTRVNGRVLVPGVSTRLREGDHLQVGPRSFEVMGKKKAEVMKIRLKAIERARTQNFQSLRRKWDEFWASEKTRAARVTVGWTLFFLVLATYRVMQHENMSTKTAWALALFYLLVPGFVLAGYFFQPKRVVFIYAVLTAALATDILHKEAIAYQRRSEFLSDSAQLERTLPRSPTHWDESRKAQFIRDLGNHLRSRPYQAGLDFSRQLEISNCVAQTLEREGQSVDVLTSELAQHNQKLLGRLHELSAECTVEAETQSATTESQDLQ